MTTKDLYTTSRIISIDLETTNLDPAEAKIIEFGYSIWENSEFVERNSFYLNPGFEISQEVTDITGISNTDLVNQPTFEDKFPRIDHLVSDCDVWMCFNAPYDVNVLRNEYSNINCQLPDNKSVVDVLVFFRKFERGNKGKKLVDAAKRFNIPYVSAHRADDDAHMTQQIFWRMLKTKPELKDEIEPSVRKQREWAESQANQLQNFFRFSKVGGEPFKYPDLSVYEMGLPKELFEEDKKKREERKAKRKKSS